MKPAILDTDILSAFLRGNVNVFSKIEKYLTEYGIINISVITYYEIQNGLLYKDARKQLSKFENFVALNDVIPLTVSIAHNAANIQAYLRASGLPIGHTDTLIARTAITHKLQLITNNTEHFRRIKNLDYDNWI